MPVPVSDDRIALQDVMLNYAAAVDERDRERYRNCFTDDVEVHNFGDQTFKGRDEWIDYVWSALEKYAATQHLLSPQLASIKGDTAKTQSNVQATHFLADKPNQQIILWASYNTDMRREQGQWKICRHELIVRGSRSS
jgi:ketosteroid isomerase-like protein